MADKPAVSLSVDGNSTPLYVKPKVFGTGSDGFNVSGKVEIDGKRFQMSGNLVRIGSAKENAEAS